MAHTSEEIPLPGGVTIDFDKLQKAAKAGKDPAECVKEATEKYAPKEVAPDEDEPETETSTAKGAATTEKE